MQGNACAMKNTSGSLDYRRPCRHVHVCVYVYIIYMYSVTGGSTVALQVYKMQ